MSLGFQPATDKPDTNITVSSDDPDPVAETPARPLADVPGDSSGPFLPDGPTPLMLALALIDTDAGTQGRANGNDPRRVDAYAADMEAGELPRFPPVVVFRSTDPADPDHYYIGDGFHRVAAAKRVEDIDAIQALIHPGGFRAAWLHSRKANTDHGLRRSPEDTKAIIESILRDPILGKLSSRELEPYCKVSHTTIQKHRRRLFPKTPVDPYAPLDVLPTDMGEVDAAGFPTGLGYDDRRALLKRLTDIPLLQRLKTDSPELKSDQHSIGEHIQRLTALQQATTVAGLLKSWKLFCGDYYPTYNKPHWERHLLERLAALADKGLPADMTDAAGQFRASLVADCANPKTLQGWLAIDGISRTDRQRVLQQWAWVKRVQAANKSWELSNLSTKGMPPAVLTLYKAQQKALQEKSKAADKRRDWLSAAKESTPEKARKLLKQKAEDKKLIQAWWKGEEEIGTWTQDLARRRSRAAVRAMLRQHLESTGLQLETCTGKHCRARDICMVMGKRCPRCSKTRQQTVEAAAERAEEWKDNIAAEVELAAAHLPPEALHTELAARLKDALGVEVQISATSDDAPEDTPEAVSTAPEAPTPRPDPATLADGEPLTFPAGTHHTVRTLLTAAATAVAEMSGPEFDTLMKLSPQLASAMNTWLTTGAQLLDEKTATINAAQAERLGHVSMLHTNLGANLDTAGVPSVADDNTDLPLIERVDWLIDRATQARKYDDLLDEAGVPRLDPTDEMVLDPEERMDHLTDPLDAVRSALKAAFPRLRGPLGPRVAHLAAKHIEQRGNIATLRGKLNALQGTDDADRLGNQSEAIAQLTAALTDVSAALDKAQAPRQLRGAEAADDLDLTPAQRVERLQQAHQLQLDMQTVLLNTLDGVMSDAGVPRKNEIGVEMTRLNRLSRLTGAITALNTTAEEATAQLRECHGMLDIPLGRPADGEARALLHDRLQRYMDANLSSVSLMSAAGSVVTRWCGLVDLEALSTPWPNMGLHERLRAVVGAWENTPTDPTLQQAAQAIVENYALQRLPPTDPDAEETLAEQLQATLAGLLQISRIEEINHLTELLESQDSPAVDEAGRHLSLETRVARLLPTESLPADAAWWARMLGRDVLDALTRSGTVVTLRRKSLTLKQPRKPLEKATSLAELSTAAETLGLDIELPSLPAAAGGAS